MVHQADNINMNVYGFPPLLVLRLSRLCLVTRTSSVLTGSTTRRRGYASPQRASRQFPLDPYQYTGCFIIYSGITKIYVRKNLGLTSEIQRKMRTFINRCLRYILRISIHPCMALQPLPGLGLPQSVPPLFPVFSYSSPSSYS
jgi:hypothetical protein